MLTQEELDRIEQERLKELDKSIKVYEEVIANEEIENDKVLERLIDNLIKHDPYFENFNFKMKSLHLKIHEDYEVFIHFEVKDDEIVKLIFDLTIYPDDEYVRRIEYSKKEHLETKNKTLIKKFEKLYNMKAKEYAAKNTQAIKSKEAIKNELSYQANKIIETKQSVEMMSAILENNHKS